MSWAECGCCEEMFTSDSGFDRHLAHPNARENCYDPRTLRDSKNRRVFEQVQRSTGPAWKLKSHKPHHLASKPPTTQSGDDNSVVPGESQHGNSDAAVEAQTLVELKAEIRGASE